MSLKCKTVTAQLGNALLPDIFFLKRRRLIRSLLNELGLRKMRKWSCLQVASD